MPGDGWTIPGDENGTAMAGGPDMNARIAQISLAIVQGLVRSTAFALCASIVPVCVALLPVLAAFGLVGSPWSWSNPWSWGALAIIAIAVTLALAHPVAVLFRRLVAGWSGVVLADGYRANAEPVRLSTGFWWNGASYERTRDDALTDQRMRRATEPAYWREVRWAVLAAPIVLPVCAVPLAALAGGIVVLVLEAWWLPIVAGVLLLVLAAAVAPVAWRLVRPLAQRWLAPSTPALLRAAHEQRADLTAAHDAEIRRIERDLHDGAQSRLIAVGLDIAAAQRLIASNPAEASELLRTARAGTTESLNQLRDLVRGVYPPVLIERGIVPALRSLALDSPVRVEVNGPDDLRMPTPLSAAMYFCVAELLTNATKHARASRVDITVTSGGGRVDAVVRDDGVGGASVHPGGGLDGARRRLAAFDATLDIDSPRGGPTTVRVRMPCA
jgi:signal transduction histidine kinase